MVSNFTNLLGEEYADDFDDTAKQYFYYISDGAQRMRLLIEDLLTYARLDQNIEEMTLTNCNREYKIVLNDLASVIEGKGAQLTADKLPEVYASPIRINRLLQNLVGNAIKYASTERKPVVHIACQEHDHEWVFSIADNGIGMKEEYLEQIFVIFKRLHTREYQGTGIGLAICRKIVDSLGGKIWAESKLGKGSTIYFTIPKMQ